jgi:nucleoside-diphosphate-sugar epimerase
MSLGRELACAEIAADVTTIVRSAPIYGLGDTHNSYGPNRFARQALEDGQIALFGAGEAGRDHVAVADVAAVIVRCVNEREPGIVNVASGQMRTFAQVAELVRVAAPEGTTIVSMGSESSATFRSFDVSNLVRRFPDHVPTTPEAGIPVMVRDMASAV